MCGANSIVVVVVVVVIRLNPVTDTGHYLMPCVVSLLLQLHSLFLLLLLLLCLPFVAVPVKGRGCWGRSFLSTCLQHVRHSVLVDDAGVACVAFGSAAATAGAAAAGGVTLLCWLCCHVAVHSIITTSAAAPHCACLPTLPNVLQLLYSPIAGRWPVPSPSLALSLLSALLCLLFCRCSVSCCSSRPG